MRAGALVRRGALAVLGPQRGVDADVGDVGLERGLALVRVVAVPPGHGGDAGAEARDAHEANIAERYRQYLQQRAYFYALERRWPDAPFWRNRSDSGSRGASFSNASIS